MRVRRRLLWVRALEAGATEHTSKMPVTQQARWLAGLGVRLAASEKKEGYSGRACRWLRAPPCHEAAKHHFLLAAAQVVVLEHLPWFSLTGPWNCWCVGVWSMVMMLGRG